jgi:hypothetical protein
VNLKKVPTSRIAETPMSHRRVGLLNSIQMRSA